MPGFQTPLSAAEEDILFALEKHLPPWEFVGQTYFGNFCTIYQAKPRHRDVPASYAVKVLKLEWCSKEIGASIMQREAEVGQSISHPHLVPVLDADLASEIPYVVQPWLEGMTLRDWLVRGFSADLSEMLWIARQVAEALLALENAGYCHCDIKPGNIHLSSGGHVTLIDLGMSRRLSGTEKLMDRTVGGTPHYMAPELKWKNASPDISSDIFSLGMVMQEMISRKKFNEVPQTVTDFVMRMISFDPEERPKSAKTLLRDLVPLEIQLVGQYY
ncbi:MAG: serine/threonine protein kinase [Planctomycetaceae bacterium]|nr:serine/threonine protein kinase [Planctomycetaceae bacterium]